MWWDKSPYSRPAAMLVAILSMAGLAGCNEYRSFAWGGGVSWQQARAQSLDHQQTAARGKPASALRHVVMPGDTVSELAEAYRISVKSIVTTNGLGAPHKIYVGQVLEMPAGPVGITTPARPVRVATKAAPARGIARSKRATTPRGVSGDRIHVVARGETVTSIANDYGYRTGDVLAVNRTIDPRRLVVGTAVMLPAVQVRNIRTVTARAAQPVAKNARTTPVAARPAAVSPQPPVQVAALPAPRPRKRPPPAVLTAPPALTGNGFVWPVRGELISTFGPQPNGSQNDGVNVRAVRGATVIAVENGVVVYAGSDIPAFGRMLMIRHGGDFLSAYAHNATLLVAEGDQVRQGQPIAKVGATGDVLEPQLHFELRKGRDAVDPIKHLRGGNVQVAQKD